jgi:protease I
VFIGGPGAEVYFHDDTAHDLVNEAVAKNKVVAAICIAPCILAYAGVLNGKNATVWSDSKEYINILEAEGAHYTGDTVTVDGKLITANGPDATQSFAKMIVKLLAGEN